MALVCFEKIAKLSPNDNVDYLDLPLIKSELYTLPWGYLTFKQRLETEYNEADTYTSHGVFTISGSFTVSAEERLQFPGVFLGEDGSVANPVAALNQLTSRYEDLVDLFAGAANAAAPDDTNDWYGADDPRCIKLPDQLVDKAGNPIYALPVSIEIGESHYPQDVHYTATLREGTPPASILLVNGIPLHAASVNVSPPRPEVNRIRTVGGIGSLTQVSSYSSTAIQVSGVIPTESAAAFLNATSQALARSLMAGTAKVELVRWRQTTTKQTLFPKVWVDQPTIDLRPHERGVFISFRGVV